MRSIGMSRRHRSSIDLPLGLPDHAIGDTVSKIRAYVVMDGHVFNIRSGRPIRKPMTDRQLQIFMAKQKSKPRQYKPIMKSTTTTTKPEQSNTGLWNGRRPTPAEMAADIKRHQKMGRDAMASHKLYQLENLKARGMA